MLCLVAEARERCNVDNALYRKFMEEDLIAQVDKVISETWSPLLRARVTKLEVMLVRVATKPLNGGFTMDKKATTLQTLKRKFLEDTRQWYTAVDADDVIWAPLKEALTKVTKGK